MLTRAYHYNCLHSITSIVCIALQSDLVDNPETYAGINRVIHAS